MQVLIIVAQAALTHAPVHDFGSADSPLVLGDATEDSWVMCSKLGASDVAYYQFNVSQTAGDAGRFWMGVYTPGCDPHKGLDECPDHDTDFAVGVWGMEPNTTCRAWEDWGDVAAQPHSAVPASVTAPVGSWDSVAVFEAPAYPVQRPIFEPFTPTAFTPRVTCVGEYTRYGTYTLGVWRTATSSERRHVCVGLGLAEQSVYRPSFIVSSSYVAWQMHSWNRWSFVALTWAWWMLGGWWWWWISRLARPPIADRPRRAVMLAAIAVAGQSVYTFVVLTWSAAVSTSASVAVWALVLLVRVLVPLVIVRFAFATALQPLTLRAGSWLIGYGVFLLLIGAGFIVAPIAMIVAGVQVRYYRKSVAETTVLP